VAISAQDVKLLREKTGAGFMDCKKALSESGGDFQGAVRFLREKGLAEAGKRSGREVKEGIITVVYNEGKNSGLMVEINCETDFVSRTDKYREFVQEIANSLLESDVEDPQNLPDTIQDSVKEAISSFGENIIIRKITRFVKEDERKSVFNSYIHLDGKVGVIVEFLLADESLQKSDVFQEFAKNVSLQIASMAPLYVSREEFPQDIISEQRDIFEKQAKESGKPEKIMEKIVNGRMEKYFAEASLLEQKYVKDSDITLNRYLQNVEEALKGKFEIKRFARFKLGEE
jgi:elongation factor Ts